MPGRRRGGVITLVIALGCVTCSDAPTAREPAVHGDASPEVENAPDRPRASPLPTGGREITLRASEATPVREVTLELPTDGSEYTLRKATGGRVIFEGPHSELVGRGPVAPGRFLVAVKASEADDAALMGVHLVDVERGSVARFDDATGWQAPKLGLAEVLRRTPLGDELLLLHARDGHTVSMDAPYVGTATDVAIHPGRGDAWVFTHDPEKKTTKVAHWTDLRQPPPIATKELPFFAFDEYAAHRNERWTTHVDVPSADSPLDTDPIVRASESWNPDEEACRRVALHRDGTFGCANYILELGEGWFSTRDASDMVLFNSDTHEIQRIELDICEDRFSGILVATHTPPRALIMCDLNDEYLLWKPGTLERVRMPRSGAEPHWERNVSASVYVKGRREHGSRLYTQWMDLVDDVLVHTPELRMSASRRWERAAPLTDSSGRQPLVLVLALDPPRFEVIQRRACRDPDAEVWSPKRFALTCSTVDGRVVHSDIIDLATRSTLRIPKSRRGWYGAVVVDDERDLAVSIRRRGKRDELVVWRLD
jgi:hypothetical protein